MKPIYIYIHICVCIYVMCHRSYIIFMLCTYYVHLMHIVLMFMCTLQSGIGHKNISARSRVFLQKGNDLSDRTIKYV